MKISLLLNSQRTTRLTSCLSFYLMPSFFSYIYCTLYHTLSDTSSHMHLHAYCTYYPYRLILVVPSLASNVLCVLAPVLEIEPLAETILRCSGVLVR